jgi:hypothetical protein
MNVSVSIYATPKRAFLCHASDDETTLIIKCTAQNDSGVIEIGKEHVFASRKNRSLFSRRRTCELDVRIKRRSSVSEETATKLSLSKDKIGELTFFPPIRKGKGNDASPASLGASVFLDDQLFDCLMNTLQSGKRSKLLQLDIESEGTLEFGWEPDGSRMEWKIANPSEPSHIDVISIEMWTDLFN